MTRLLSIVVLCALLGACAGRTRDCAELAGPGWKTLAKPPPDAPELLTRAGLASDSELVWFNQGPDKVLLCAYAKSLVNPGCNASRGYPYQRVNGQWTAGGVLLDVCKY